MIFVAYKKLRYFLITHRLQKLFMSLKISEHMTWYPPHDVKDKVMMHFFNGETWKQFNRVHFQFSPYNSLFFFSFFFLISAYNIKLFGNWTSYLFFNLLSSELSWSHGFSLFFLISTFNIEFIGNNAS
jgi:hypothetical protein